MSANTNSQQKAGKSTQEHQNIQFFAVLKSEENHATDVVSPYFETLTQAEAFLKTVENIYENAFIAQFASFNRDPEEQDRLLSLIVKERAVSYETMLNDVITWFFVTRPVQKGNQLFRGIPISANFRAKAEANRWLAECGFDDAYILWHSMECYPTGRAATEADIFDGKCPATAISYQVETLRA